MATSADADDSKSLGRKKRFFHSFGEKNLEGVHQET